VEGHFVGEVPFDGTNYKFYQHQKAGLEIFSSNLWWDKAERSVDDYIVSQITLTAEDFATPRGVHVGSTIRELNNAYGDGQFENDSGSSGFPMNWVRNCSLLRLRQQGCENNNELR
jgi:hypothetical protein